MAITGKFEADFSSFAREVDKAVVSLNGFQQTSEKVGKSLSQMADRFSGTKIVEQGLEINRLFKTTEDLALLTKRELAEVGATAAEAADKMQRLGLEVPENLRQIANEAGNTGGAFSRMLDIAGGMGLVTSIESALSWLKQFTAEIFRSADEMQKLSDKTAISAEDLQRFQAAGTTAGNSINEITNAITTMQDHLASGDKSAVAALDRLGLSIQDLQGLSPADRFREIARAIRDIQDPAEQTRDAIDVFGRTGAAILPTIKSNFQGVGAAAIVMSSETTKALSDTGSQWSLFWSNLKSLGGEAIADVLTLSLSKTRELRSEFGNLAKDATDNAPKIAAIAPPGLPADLGAIEQKLADEAASLKIAADAAAAFTKELNASTKAAHDVEQSVKTMVDFSIGKIGERSTAEQDYVKASVAGYAQIQKVASDNADFVMRQTLSETDYKVAKINEWARAQIAAFQGTAAELDAYTAAVQTRAQQQIDALTRVTAVITDQERALAQLQQDAITTFADITNVSQSLERLDTQGRIHAGPAGGSVTNPGGFSLGPTFTLPGFTLSARAADAFRPSTPGGSTVVNNFQVVDTEANIVRRVSDQITRSIKTSTKWGAA